MVTDVLVLGNRIFRHIKMTKVLSNLSKPRVASMPILISAIHCQADGTVHLWKRNKFNNFIWSQSHNNEGSPGTTRLKLTYIHVGVVA